MRRAEEPEERTMLVNQPAFSQSGKVWRPYRFDRLEKVSRTQAMLAQKLDWLLPSAATGKVNDAVLGRLRAMFEQDVELAVDYVHVIRPKDFRKYVADPTFLAVLAPAPHKTRGLLEVELSLAHAAIDLLLGGTGDAVPLRPLTDIEEGVMSFVVLEALKALAPSIQPGMPQLRLESIAPRVDDAMTLMAEETQLVVVQFKALLGPNSGFMRLFLPATLVGSATPLEEGPERRARRAQATAAHLVRLSTIKTWLRAEIGHAEISTRDLAELHNGDVVIADEITARCDRGQAGTAKLRVGLGRVGRLDAEVRVEAGRYRATITAIALGEAPRQAREPTDRDEEAAESLSGDRFAGVDAEADAEQDVGSDEESTNPTNSGVLPRDRVEASQLKEDGAELLNDIPLQIAVELARIPVTAEEVVSLKVGQVLDLNRVPGEPVELSVNGKVVARGELVEVEGHLGVRILSLAG